MIPSQEKQKTKSKIQKMTIEESLVKRESTSPMKKVTTKICSAIFLLLVTGLIAYALEELIYKMVAEDQNDEDGMKSNDSSVEASPILDNSCKKRVVAYYGFWSTEEITMGQFSKLTHVIFNPLIVTIDGLVSFRSSADQKKFEDMNKLAKTFEVKTMFSIGLAEIFVRDMDTYMFSYFATDKERRRKLVNSIVSFTHKHQLDGVEFNWLGPISKENSTILPILCREVRTELTNFAKVIGRSSPFLLSVQCPTRKTEIDFGEVLKYVDFISIETTGYNLYDTSPNFTIAGSPLYSGPENVDKTMKELICRTEKPSQTNIMVNFDGHFWNNVTTSTNGKWLTPTEKDGIIGGDLVLWKYMKGNGWNVSSYSWNDESKMPYIWKQEERSYLAFENDRSLREKVKYITEHNIGGIAITWIDNDDSSNTLLSAVASEEKCPDSFKKYNCSV